MACYQTAARSFSFASSTFIRERMKVMMASRANGITRYMIFSILMQESGCTVRALSKWLAAQLHTQRSAGVHRAIHVLMLRQPSIFRASSNRSIHIALPRTLTKSCDCSKKQHQGHIAAAHVTSYSNQCTRNRCQSIAHYIQLIHSIPLLLVLCGRDQSAAHFRLEFSLCKLPKSLAFRLKIL